MIAINKVTEITHVNKKKMKTTKLFLTLLLAMAAAVMSAQKAEPIKGIVRETHDSAWYAAQVMAWEREVCREPKSEAAWQNLFNATRYACMFSGEDYRPAQQVVERMRRKIPGTFTYHYCRFQASMGDEPDQDMERAIELGDDNIDAYDAFIGYLWRTGQFGRMYDFGRRYFESGWFSPNLLQYAYNQLAGLPDGAIFIGNGDSELIPKIVLQAGKDVHRDKVIVPLSFLNSPYYVDSLCARLGIQAPEISPTPANWDEAADSVVRYLIEKSGRPVYFAPTIGAERLKAFSDRLYSEGLVLRYSATPYDNLAVMKRNVEQRYLLDYLRMSFVPQKEWVSAGYLQLNYVVALQPLLRFYRESDDSARLSWLTGLLSDAIESAPCDDTRKARYRELLKGE